MSYEFSYILKNLPHRYPFLFVDKILEISDTSITGLKYVSPDETYFKGHFPGRPVMPGVLQIEAMAQVGGVLVLSTFPDPENYLTFFARIENVLDEKYQEISGYLTPRRGSYAGFRIHF